MVKINNKDGTTLLHFVKARQILKHVTVDRDNSMTFDPEGTELALTQAGSRSITQAAERFIAYLEHPQEEANLLMEGTECDWDVL